MKKWFRNNKENIFFVLLTFVAWRVWLQFFLLLGWFVLPLGDRFLVGGMENFLRHPNLLAWANFDGEHYLAIAQHGYGMFDQVLFPFYPFLIKTFIFPLKESLFTLLFSGLTISNLSFLIALFLLYLLVKLDFNQKTARWTILFLLVFPTSFFFGSVYNESLFLLLILGSFYTARRGNWWLAGILGAFASATRPVGIFLLPALLWEWWEQNKIKNEKLKMKNLFNLLPIFLVSAGLLWYMRYLAINYQDPLMFLHSQPAFGAQRVADKVILLHQVCWRYFKMIATTKANLLYFTVWLEFLSAAFSGILLVFGYLRKIRLSYLIFAFLAFIVPTLTGTFSSMPRYVLVLFPCFIALSLIKSKWFRLAWIVLSILLLFVATIFFTRGYFVG